MVPGAPMSVVAPVIAQDVDFSRPVADPLGD